MTEKQICGIAAVIILAVSVIFRGVITEDRDLTGIGILSVILVSGFVAWTTRD